MESVLTLTFNPAVDAASGTDIVRPTHKIRTREESFYPGGGGINVTRMIARLGGQVSALYARGGIMGSVLDHLLEECALLTKTVRITGNTRINNIIHENSTGLEYRFVAEGPILEACEWQACVKACEACQWDWLIVSGSLPHGVPVEVYDQLAELARRRKAEIVLDTSGDGLKHIMTRKGATLIKPSQREFEACTQRCYTSIAQIAEAAQKLVYEGVSKIITVTLGHKGAVLATADRTLHLAAPLVRTVSASGAGDSFIGGMVHVLAQGGHVEDAFKLGIACGSAAVMEKGAHPPRMENIRQLYMDLAPGSPGTAVLPAQIGPGLE